MSDISAKSVMDLRSRTGLGVMECKRALAACDDNIDDAIDYLRRTSKIKSAKKASRVAAEGIVLTGVNKDARYGVVVELNSETDFVARDDNFVAFTQRLVNEAMRIKAKDPVELMGTEMEEARRALVQKVGENVVLRRLYSIESTDGDVAAYTHGNKRVATLVCIRGGTNNLARDVAMHVAATAPLVLSPKDMPEELITKERKLYTAQAIESGKPADIIEKIVVGKVNRYMSESSLTEQPFVKDPAKTISTLLQDAKAEILKFMRYEVGEGIEKSEVDFAAEVAQQAGLQ